MKPAVLRSVSNYSYVYYINQDNYYIADLSTMSQKAVYYCDSITSCIVIIVVGKSSKEQKMKMIISHLSKPGRFEYFFKLVEELFELNPVAVYAFGANPSIILDSTEENVSLRNASQVLQWLSSNRLTISQLTLKLGEGNPSVYDNNLDCCCFTWDGVSKYEVSNTRYYINDLDRDPTNGVQTMFNMYGDPNYVRLQSEPFTKEEIAKLVQKAREKGLDKAATMSNDEILEKYSSTPEYEVSWFCEGNRQAGKFVQTYE